MEKKSPDARTPIRPPPLPTVPSVKVSSPQPLPPTLTLEQPTPPKPVDKRESGPPESRQPTGLPSDSAWSSPKHPPPASLPAKPADQPKPIAPQPSIQIGDTSPAPARKSLFSKQASTPPTPRKENGTSAESLKPSTDPTATPLSPQAPIRSSSSVPPPPVANPPRPDPLRQSSGHQTVSKRNGHAPKELLNDADVLSASETTSDPLRGPDSLRGQDLLSASQRTPRSRPPPLPPSARQTMADKLLQDESELPPHEKERRTLIGSLRLELRKESIPAVDIPLEDLRSMIKVIYNRNWLADEREMRQVIINSMRVIEPALYYIANKKADMECMEFTDLAQLFLKKLNEHQHDEIARELERAWKKQTETAVRA